MHGAKKEVKLCSPGNVFVQSGEKSKLFTNVDMKARTVKSGVAAVPRLIPVFAREGARLAPIVIASIATGNSNYSTFQYNCIIHSPTILLYLLSPLSIEVRL